MATGGRGTVPGSGSAAPGGALRAGLSAPFRRTPRGRAVSRGADARLLALLAAGLSSLSPSRIRVAYSGGPDSTALLHLLARLPAARDAALCAVHVDHHMLASSQDWVRHCRRFCAGHRIPLEVREVDPGLHRERGPEGAARQVRYTALLAGSGPDTLTVTAHHQEDLAETLLLRLVRGSGPAGLAGIPQRRRFGRGWLWRPLLEVPREVLTDYVTRHDLPFVCDPSNADPRLDRGFLREAVMPVLGGRWPKVAAALARAASHQRDTRCLLEALAARDCKAAVDSEGAFSVAVAQAWPLLRTAGALRCWLAESDLPVPEAAGIARIIGEVIGARDDAAPVLRWPGGEVRRYRGRLYAGAPLPACNPCGERPWKDLSTPLALEQGRLWAQPERGRGLAARCASRGALRVRFRRGGERCRPSGRAHSQTLKRLFQEYGVPPWERARVPLLHEGRELVAVAGWWICQGFEAAPDEPGWSIHWRPRSAKPGCRPGEGALRDLPEEAG